MNPSPEALIVAATSASAAHYMATIAAVLSGIAVIVSLITGAVCVWTTFKFDALVSHFNSLVLHTNSIVDRLITTTASESEARGDLAGRAALKQEQKVDANEAADPPDTTVNMEVGEMNVQELRAPKKPPKEKK